MCHTGVTTPDGTSLLLIGGQSGQTTRFDDVFQFDGSKFHSLNQSILDSGAGPNERPPRFARHTTVCIGNCLYTFGGFDGVGHYFGLAVYNIDTKEWKQVDAPNTPALRTNHAAAAIGSKMYIYGGNRTDHDQYVILDDLHVFDTDTMTWHSPLTTGDLPGPRVAHKLAAVGDRLLLFGGGNWTPQQDWLSKSNKVYELDTSSMRWREIKATNEAAVRASSFAIPFTFSHWLFLYGGQALASGAEIDELVSFDTVSHSWHHHVIPKGKQNPGPRSVGTANFCGGHVWLFGGSGAHCLENTMHRLSHPLFLKAKNYIRT
jgi:N-acetylneuraminic acid mutarotase